jgi:hypothetical protein
MRGGLEVPKCLRFSSGSPTPGAILEWPLEAEQTTVGVELGFMIERSAPLRFVPPP